MIIMDMNQISLASLMMDLNMRKSDEVREDLVRHMILNSIRMYRTDLNTIGEEITFQIIKLVEKKEEKKIVKIGILYLIV